MEIVGSACFPSFISIYLQCCHEFSFMEIYLCDLPFPADISPSMLPWIFIHGNRAIRSRIRMGFRAFNVAMNFHSWKFLQQWRDRLFCVYLQCCHEFSFMEIIGWEIWIRSIVVLQCCHEFSFMEITDRQAEEIGVRSLQCCHEFSFMEMASPCAIPSSRLSPSMLPWIFIHGNGYEQWHSVVCNRRLQCCHEFSFMEIRHLDRNYGK